MSIKVRESARLPLGRHWLVVSSGAVVADIYANHGRFTTIVRVAAVPFYESPPVVSFDSLESASVAFIEGWRG